MTIQYINDSLSKILEYLEKRKSKNNINIQIDPDAGWDSEALIFEDLVIKNLKIEEIDNNKYIASFDIPKGERNLIKLCYTIKKFGDGGHSYTIVIDDKKIGWDGDGSDRINEINGIDCKSWKDIENDYIKYMTPKEVTESNINPSQHLSKFYRGLPYSKEALANDENRPWIWETDNIDYAKEYGDGVIEYYINQHQLVDNCANAEDFYQVMEIEGLSTDGYDFGMDEMYEPDEDMINALKKHGFCAYILPHGDRDDYCVFDYRLIKGKELTSVNEGIENDIDLNTYVPKKAFVAVQKFNRKLNDFRQYTGNDNEEILDTSSGTEWFFWISELEIKNGALIYDTKDSFSKKVERESWNFVREDEDEGYWFDMYDFAEHMKYLNKCLNKAIKYFKEYNPDFDDNEKARNNFLSEL